MVARGKGRGRSEEGRGWKRGEGGKEVWKKEEKEKEKSGGKEECLVVGGGSVRGWFRNRKFAKSISFFYHFFFSLALLRLLMFGNYWQQCQIMGVNLARVLCVCV